MTYSFRHGLFLHNLHLDDAKDLNDKTNYVPPNKKNRPVSLV
jgi:hypothetical protein